MYNGFGAMFHTKILIDIEDQLVIENRQQASDALQQSLHKLLPSISLDNYTYILDIDSSRQLLAEGNGRVWFKASTLVDSVFRNKQPNQQEKITTIITELQEQKRIKKSFNPVFFLKSDSRNPKNAGVLGAILGSALTIIVCLTVAIPIGVLSGIYLEEFMPQNTLNRFIQTGINTLSSTPAIIFGILGLALYINYLGMPRSSALAGGLTLSLMMLPTVIISTRQSVSNIPSSIKQAALALGALKTQATLHHTLPLALPGILTGIILGLSRVLGESAPLLMIGMLAFIVDLPSGFMEPTTVFPTQIYIWSATSEPGYQELTSATILILLITLLCFNFLASLIRNKFGHKFD